MGFVEIYHFIGKEASIDKILKEGLKSRKQLILERDLESFEQTRLFSGHFSNIYFQWLSPHLEINLEECSWISIEVNPETTNVFNRELRPFIFSYISRYASSELFKDNDFEDNARGIWKKYALSEMSLSKYIFKHKKSRELKKNMKLGESIVYDPLTAEPTIISLNDPRKYFPIWMYFNEILIPKQIIRSSEFKNYHESINQIKDSKI